MASPFPVLHWLRGSLIGAGSFGTVSLAINKDSGELFAVKSIECCERTRAELLAIENELRILQSLDSPSIVRCLGSDYSVENGVQMRNLFMEYMAGGSLADLMKKFGGQLDEALIRVYTRGILEGLDYLHGQGVVHCDIKGKNILIGSSGVKIADLGSAKTLGTQELGMGCLKGTPLWMAPEVIMQQEQGTASDIWSLGCTIVEMATGRPPWSKSLNLFAMFLKSVNKVELPPLPECLSEEGKDFLRKCLQRDSTQRWTTGQLLEHPFVEKKARVESRVKIPLSPTSVLDDTTSDWDSQTGGSSSDSVVPVLRLIAPSRGGIREGTWITVTRSPRKGGEDRQKPLSSFMLQQTSGAAPPTSAADVNLECLEFLRRRPRCG